MGTLEIFVSERVLVSEPGDLQILVWCLADLNSFFSVIAALSSGVIYYAEEQGILN